MGFAGGPMACGVLRVRFETRLIDCVYDSLDGAMRRLYVHDCNADG